MTTDETIITCRKCGQRGFMSAYLPMCTECANKEREASGEIKSDNVPDDGSTGLPAALVFVAGLLFWFCAVVWLIEWVFTRCLK